eukprot:6204027-Pleurochrysis_carterae.AAC.2
MQTQVCRLLLYSRLSLDPIQTLSACNLDLRSMHKLQSQHLLRDMTGCGSEGLADGIVHPSVEAGGAAARSVCECEQPDDAQRLALHDAARLLLFADRTARLARRSPPSSASTSISRVSCTSTDHSK